MNRLTLMVPIRHLAPVRRRHVHGEAAHHPPHLALRVAGQGPPLVLIHGLASSSRYWGRPLPLSDRFRVYAPDLLGFGRSPKPRDADYTPAAHVAALAATLRPRLRRPVTLVGHSLGTLVALHFTATHPELVERLVLISPPIVGDRAWGHGADGSMRPFHRFGVHSRSGALLFSAGMRIVHPLWAAVGPRLRQDVPAAATRDALACSWLAYWRSLEEIVYGTHLPDMLERVSVPVTMIHGPLDTVAPVGPVRELAAARPNLRYVEIGEAGHNPFFSHRAETIAAMLSATEQQAG